MIHTFRQDFTFAWRQLLKSPSFSLVALFTLALGIGVTTMFFSVLNSFVLRPLPYENADRIVVLQGQALRGGGNSISLSVSDYLHYRQRSVFESTAVYNSRTFDLGTDAELERLSGAAVSTNFLRFFGHSPALGRHLSADEINPGGGQVALLSHALWTRSFAGDPEVLGREIKLDGEIHTVVGVAPAGFDFPQATDLWMPLNINATDGTEPAGDHSLAVVARLKTGVSLQQANTELAASSPHVDHANSMSNTEWAVQAVFLRDLLGRKHRDSALLMLAAASLALLIACANLANLLLAHVTSRRHELALRAALGAGRWRIVRQLITESVLLALAGGLLGVLLAFWGLAALEVVLGIPAGATWMALTIDFRVLLFALTVSMTAGLGVSLVPALLESRVDLRSALQEGGRESGPGNPGQWLGRGLVVGQLALSLALMAGATTVVASSFRVEDEDPGFDRRNLVALRLSLDGAVYETADQRNGFIEQAIRRLESVPGVLAASVTSHLPLVDRNVPGARFVIDGWDDLEERLPTASYRLVGAGYAEFLRIPLGRGRTFTRHEALGTQPTNGVMINTTMARRFWPDEDPIGQRLRLVGAADPEAWLTVLGVVGDVAQRQLPARPENQLYLPLAPARDTNASS